MGTVEETPSGSWWSENIKKMKEALVPGPSIRSVFPVFPNLRCPKITMLDYVGLFLTSTFRPSWVVERLPHSRCVLQVLKSRVSKS